MIEKDQKYQKLLIAFQTFLEDIIAPIDPTIYRFTEYLDRIHARDLYGRMETLVKRYAALHDDIVTDIFVSEDEEKKWETLWLFSESNCAEITDFQTEDNFKQYELKGNITTPKIEPKHYTRTSFEDERELYESWKGILKSSELKVTVRLPSGEELSFKAREKNCDFLLNIFNKYIKANKA
jgi:hypothetical protein